MEHPAGKRFFTRRRLVAGGVPLLLVLAVSLVLWRPQSVSRDLKLEFVGFTTSDDGGSADYAVVRVRNQSSRTWVLLGAREWLPLKDDEESPFSMFQALGRFATGPSTGENGRVSRSDIGGGAGGASWRQTL